MCCNRRVPCFGRQPPQNRSSSTAACGVEEGASIGNQLWGLSQTHLSSGSLFGKACPSSSRGSKRRRGSIALHYTKGGKGGREGRRKKRERDDRRTDLTEQDLGGKSGRRSNHCEKDLGDDLEKADKEQSPLHLAHVPGKEIRDRDRQTERWQEIDSQEKTIRFLESGKASSR